MKINDFITIIIRLLALFLLVTSMQYAIPHFVYLIDNQIFLIDSLISFLIPIIGFALLWYFSTKLAQIVTTDIPSKIKYEFNYHALLRIVVITIGFSLLVNSVINLSYWFFNNMVFKANPELSGSVDTIHIQKTYLTTELVQTLLAVIILAKNSWLTQALLKINAPEKPDIENNSAQSD
jgi:hypothetical protein